MHSVRNGQAAEVASWLLLDEGERFVEESLAVE